ncbi:MAG: glycoside hydrolase family 5 protein [Ruminococcus sp.]|nr:glycoside hydrolase family 5 protein [Ruminococcus sp.]
MLKDKGFYKGINLGGWFSQCDYSEDRLNNFITENDFRIISEWGTDHVRIPFDYNIIEDKDGNWIESGFARLADAVKLSRKYGMNVVLDLHKTAGFSFDYYNESESGFFDSEKYQERFYKLWEQMAQRFGNDPDHIAFELLNEVTDEQFIGAWNRIAHTCIERIRRFAPDTLILVGSYNNNSAATVFALDPPYDDKVVYNMHCYEPLKFTHQGAYWTNAIVPEERLSYEESECSEEYFEKLFSTAIQKAEKYGAELYCGEYGVIDVVGPEDTLKWLKCINSVFEKHGIGRAIWSYKEMDFGITSEHLNSVRGDILKYI